MYTPNHTNSLYFYPHKLHFSPAPDAADSEQRNRWFPSYQASTAKPRSKGPVADADHDGDSTLLDRDHRDEDDACLDDEGAPHASSLHDDG